MKAFAKYLERHSEPQSSAPSLAPYIQTHSICVIPIYDEAIDSLLGFLRQRFPHHVSYVFVFNCPVNADSKAIERTKTCLGLLQKEYLFQSLGQNGFYSDISETCRCYILDFTEYTHHFSEKKGVGLARKIGMDFAIRLCLEQVEHKHKLPNWLHSCDADVTLPAGYFDIEAPKQNQVVSLYPFMHKAEQGYELALKLYDFRLRYYVDQLARAGSPYAFQTVGSAIAVTPLAYIQVRGMPKRSGAEDFYFLNKLAKIGTFHQLERPVLKVSGRASDRVPFGTGPAIRDIAEMDSPLENYRYYHPQSFVRLAELLKAVVASNSIDSLDDFRDVLRANSQKYSRMVWEVLDQLDVQNFFKHLEKQKRFDQFQSEFHIWFDAFVTLRFVHLVREHHYSDLNLRELEQHRSQLSTNILQQISALLGY